MFLHHRFNYTSKFLSTLTKVVVQRVCFTPVFSIYFFGLHSLLAGATVAKTGKHLRQAVPESIANSVKLWPAVTAFSFMCIPPHFRSVFTGLVAVQTYLSWLNQRTAREVEVVDGASEAHG
jgi:Mpv17 / PMP22 family